MSKLYFLKTMNIKRALTSLGLIVTVLVLFLGPPMHVANAAALTSMKATLSTVKKAVVADQTVMFRMSSGGGGVAATESITLTYDADFSIAAALDFEDLDVSYQAAGDGVCDTGDTELTLGSSAVGATWGAVRTSATVITITSGTGTIAASAEVCVEIGTNAESVITGIERITNATTAASFNLALGGTNGDTGTIVITTVDDDTIVTSATVPASLTFGMPADVIIGFGNLSVSGSRWATADSLGAGTATSAHTITASTNSTSGYTITVNGATLASTGSPSDTITAMATEATLTTGQEEFGLRITSAGGSGAVDTVYDDTPADSYALVTAAFPDAIASSSGISATTTYTVFYAANIAATTEAHTDYSSSLTYTIIGNF